MTTFLVGALVVCVGAVGGVWAWVAGLARTEHDQAVRSWASSRGIAGEGDRYRTFVDGIPVTIETGVLVRATAVYPVGLGPAFTLTAPPVNEPPPRRDVRVQYSGVYDPPALVQRVHEHYRRRGAASDAVPRIVKAIHEHVHAPITAPTFSSDGLVVRVEARLAGHREGPVLDRIDVLAGLAASIASHDLHLLVPLATAIGSRVEIGEGGLAFVDVPRRAAIRVTLLPSAPDSQVLATTLTGTLEQGSADLARASFEASSDSPHDLVGGRADVGAALEALVGLRDARVIVSPRGARVQFPGRPPVERIVKAADALEVLLAPQSASPFR